MKLLTQNSSILIVLILFGFAYLLESASAQENATPLKSLVRVNMTSQQTYFYQPWEKRTPSTRRGLGAVLKDNKILIAAKFVANATYIELEHPVTGKKIPAEIEVVDYEANLALLVAKGEFFDDRVPISLQTDISPGDVVETWQVESNGAPLMIEGKVSRVQVSSTFLEGHYFLQYEVAGTMQFRGGSVILPLIKDNKLAGLLTSYDSKEQLSEVIPGPMIEHFLKDAEDGQYDGFPRFGISYDRTLDEQFRKYLKLPEGSGGVYVSDVKENSSAGKAGIKKGDVILAVEGHAIDSRGYYKHEKYGILSFVNLVQSKPMVGDSVKVDILRDGEKQSIKVKLIKRPPTDELVDPYMFDRGPKFLVMGGLVFQELTRTYLSMYGTDWRTRGPFKLSYAAAYPKQLEDEGLEKLVFLSRVIPSNCNVGYENIGNIRITKVNNKEISSIKDLDKAFAEPIDGFHKIELSDYPKLLFLDAEEAKSTNAEMQKSHGIHELKHLE